MQRVSVIRVLKVPRVYPAVARRMLELEDELRREDHDHRQHGPAPATGRALSSGTRLPSR